jgi:hypothetical protein
MKADAGSVLDLPRTIVNVFPLQADGFSFFARALFPKRHHRISSSYLTPEIGYRLF